MSTLAQRDVHRGFRRTRRQLRWIRSEADMLEAQKAKAVFQPGTVTEQLSRLSFNQTGSLFEENGEYNTKTCLSRGLILNERYTLEDTHRGLFCNSRDYHEAQILAFTQHVKYMPLGHHCFSHPFRQRMSMTTIYNFKTHQVGGVTSLRCSQKLIARITESIMLSLERYSPK